MFVCWLVASFIQCDFCDYKSRRKDILKRHIKSRHLKSEDTRYNCDKCSYSTNMKTYLKEHIKKHNPRINRCKVCDRKFRKVETLEKHVSKVHITIDNVVVPRKIEEYSCSLCSYTTKIKCNFSRHKLKHTTKKNHIHKLTKKEQKDCILIVM